jgi:hypothetical protein
MLGVSTTGRRPAGHRSHRLGRSRPCLRKVSERSSRCREDVHTLVALVAAAGSSTPVVASAASAITCEVCQLDSKLTWVKAGLTTTLLATVSALATTVTTLLASVATLLASVATLLTAVAALLAAVASTTTTTVAACCCISTWVFAM